MSEAHVLVLHDPVKTLVGFTRMHVWSNESTELE
jgi:hypothetical protein